MITIKSISFTTDYAKELEYFMTQNNKSRYICELIRKDIDNTTVTSIDREQIIALIEERIRGLPTSTNNNEGAEIRDNLLGLFGDLN